MGVVLSVVTYIARDNEGYFFVGYRFCVAMALIFV